MAKGNTGAPQSRIAALVHEIEREWALVELCDPPCSGTTLHGNDRRMLLKDTRNEALARIDALEQVLAIEEPETADDALAIIGLLNSEFLQFADQEQPCEKQRRKVARMIAAVGRWLWRHAGAQSPVGKQYLARGSLLTWAEVAAEARQEVSAAAEFERARPSPSVFRTAPSADSPRRARQEQ